MSNMEVQGDRLSELKNMYNNQDMASCFANLHLTMEGEVQLLKNEVSGLKTKVTEIEERVKKSEEDIAKMNDIALQGMATTITKEHNDRLRLDVWGRKWNLIIRGIQGGPREPGRETLGKVRNFFQNALKVPPEIMESMQFAACHRLAGGPETVKNIIVRFVNLLDRDDVLNLAMKLPYRSGYSVVPDLPPELAELRHKLLQKRKEMSPSERRNFKIVYLKEYPFVALKPKTK